MSQGSGADFDALTEKLSALDVGGGTPLGAIIARKTVAAIREWMTEGERGQHFVTFDEDRWLVEHSIECRLNDAMSRCEPVEAVIKATSDGLDPRMLGRWLITGVDEVGLPALERAES